MDYRVLSLQQILMIHSAVLTKDGGSDGVRDIGRLEAVVATQTQEVFGQELYPDVWHKSAAIMRGIIADHPFVDGNKRSAMLSGLTFLEINGTMCAIEKGELEDFAVKVAVDNLEVEEIARWLEERSNKNE